MANETVSIPLFTPEALDYATTLAREQTAMAVRLVERAEGTLDKLEWCLGIENVPSRHARLGSLVELQADLFIQALEALSEREQERIRAFEAALSGTTVE